MKRRELIVGLGAAATLPFAAHAQQSAKLPHVVHLSPVDNRSQVIGSQHAAARARLCRRAQYSSRFSKYSG